MVEQQPRYLLYRKNGAGVHEPAGGFDSAEAAKEHAEQDAIMRGLIDKPYQWGVSYFGAWQSYCPDWDKPRLDDFACNDYVVIDREWKEPNPATVIELPSIHFG